MSSDILELIRPHDAYVTSHFASVPRQALDAIRANPPAPKWQPGEYHLFHRAPTMPVWARALQAPERPGSCRRYRRRPGPQPVSFEPTYQADGDGYGNDPTADLRYEPVWSTRDVARFYNVTPATVRQWIRRGHLEPAGKEGPSLVFDRQVVREALDGIEGRRRSPGHPSALLVSDVSDDLGAYLSRYERDQPRGSRRGRTPASGQSGVGVQALNRLAKVRPDALVTTVEAAALLGLSPSTIRSWVRRGHLGPSPAGSAGTGRVLFRMADVYRAARR